MLSISDTAPARLATINFADLLQRYVDRDEVERSPLLHALATLERTGYIERVVHEVLPDAIKSLIKGGDDEVARLLIEAFDATHLHMDRMGNSVPLMEAVRSDRYELARWLIERGADVDFQNSAGFYPLAAAICFSDEKMVRMLLEAGADLHNDSPRKNALIYVINHGNPGMLDLLMEHGLNLKTRLLDGYTPLSFAAKSGFAAWAITELVAHGCDPDELDESDMRPVDWAVTATSGSHEGSPEDHPLVRLTLAGADLSLMREAVYAAMENHLRPDIVRMVRSSEMARKLESVMSGIPIEGDFVHNNEGDMPTSSKSCGVSTFPAL